MLFHKKEKALEGQQAGTKPEKPRKVRWSERREPSEAGLERFQDYLQTYSTNKDHPIKILCSFYKGKQKKLVETGFFLILQRSPIWIIPIATSNIINAATNPDAGSLEIILLNVMVALLFIMQNAGRTIWQRLHLPASTEESKALFQMQWSESCSSSPSCSTRKYSQDVCNQRSCEMWKMLRSF